MAQVLGINAVKYADLSTHRVSDYVFSYDKMLRFEGNTAAFLMYSYVRVAGIKRKVGKDPMSFVDSVDIKAAHNSEVSLLVHLLQFPEALERVQAELLPNRLTDYLYNLAEKFNGFFRDCRVEGDVQQDSRLLLCELTARVLKQGMNLLGLSVTERM